MPIFKCQKGVAHLFLLLLLAAGLAVGVYLVKQQTNIFPKASQKKDSPQYRGYIVEFKKEPIAKLLKRLKTAGKNETEIKTNIENYQSALEDEHQRAKADILTKLSKKDLVIWREYRNAFNGLALDINDAQAQKLKESSFVKNVYKNNQVKTTLMDSVPMINADDVWQLKDQMGNDITGKDVNVAVLDTGVDYTHPDLGSTQISERNYMFTPYSDLPSIVSNQQFAIEGERIAWISVSVTLGNQTILNVYKFGDPAIKPFLITNPPNMMVKRVVLKDNYIVYYGSTKIQSETGLYLYDLSTKSNRLIAAAQVVGNISIANGKVVYSRSPSSSLDPISVYVYDISTNTEKLIETNIDAAYMSNNLIAYKYQCSNQVTIYNLDNQTKRTISLSTNGEMKDFKGDQLLYFTCSQPKNEFVLYNIDTGNSVIISPPDSPGSSTEIAGREMKTSSVSISLTSLQQGSIQDGLIYFTKNPSHNRVMTYDQAQNRYVQINTLYSSGAIAAEGTTMCFRSSDLLIRCHLYDPSYAYPLPASVFNNKVTGGYNFINLDNDPLDDNGHGTHVSATVAGNGSLKGVAPEANLIEYKVLDYSGSGSSSVVMSGIDKAVSTLFDNDPTNNIHVISMSLGADCEGFYDTYCGPDDAMSVSVDNAVDTGISVIVAAGNSGPGSGTIGSPGTARKVITVGAVDKNKQIADFSSRGPVVSGGETVNKPDIVAPGVNICAAEWGSWYSSKRCVDDKHIAISGTSMAAPHVAGVAALIKQMYPDLSPLEIKNAIMDGAQDIGYDTSTQGKGFIDALRSIELLTPVSTPSPTPVPSGVQPEFCPQVLTFGQNPKTGECKGFTNSCLPAGWVKVKSCEKIREQP